MLFLSIVKSPAASNASSVSSLVFIANSFADSNCFFSNFASSVAARKSTNPIKFICLVLPTALLSAPDVKSVF